MMDRDEWWCPCGKAGVERTNPAEVECLRATLAVRTGQLNAARRHADEARAAVERVRALHERCDDDPGGPPYCLVCIEGGNDFVAPYPCATIRALDGGAT